VLLLLENMQVLQLKTDLKTDLLIRLEDQSIQAKIQKHKQHQSRIIDSYQSLVAKTAPASLLSDQSNTGQK
jgi:hypothetical protein